MMMGWPMMGFGGGGLGILGMILSFIFYVAIIIGIIFLIVWLVRRASYSGESMPKTSEAIVILKERYARGEIIKKEFEDVKKEITGPLLQYKNYLK
ncbi:MAG: SHOCT domain-containing protein [Actinobacteria bacterium]|nr:SHOCT domain-containing protein [Actinomycetota bacterium]